MVQKRTWVGEGGRGSAAWSRSPFSFPTYPSLGTWSRPMDCPGCLPDRLSQRQLPRRWTGRLSWFLVPQLLKLKRGLVCGPRQGTSKSCHIVGVGHWAFPSFRKDIRACGVSEENWCLRVSVPWTRTSSCSITEPGWEETEPIHRWAPPTLPRAARDSSGQAGGSAAPSVRDIEPQRKAKGYEACNINLQHLGVCFHTSSRRCFLRAIGQRNSLSWVKSQLCH